MKKEKGDALRGEDNQPEAISLQSFFFTALKVANGEPTYPSSSRVARQSRQRRTGGNARPCHHHDRR